MADIGTDQRSGVLHCLPPAGAGSNFYAQWPSSVAGLAISPLASPGHIGGLPSPPLEYVPAIAAVLANQVGVPPERWVLFGHSLGAAVAFALASEIADRHDRQPDHLVVSGRHAPHLLTPRALLHLLPQEAFLDAVVQLGGTPPEVAADPELLALSVEMLRADFKATECYKWDERCRLRCPVTVVVATQDELFAPEQAHAWQEVTTGPFRVTYLPGDHFHPRLPSAELLAAIKDALGAPPGGFPPSTREAA